MASTACQYLVLLSTVLFVLLAVYGGSALGRKLSNGYAVDSFNRSKLAACVSEVCTVGIRPAPASGVRDPFRSSGRGSCAPARRKTEAQLYKV